MTETNLWKLIERIEDMTEKIESMEDYLDSVYEHHNAYNDWIKIATDSLIDLQKQIKFIKSNRTCIP